VHTINTTDIVTSTITKKSEAKSYPSNFPCPVCSLSKQGTKLKPAKSISQSSGSNSG
jgi:hypothetical protein